MDIRVKDLAADTSVVATDIFPMDSAADGTRGVTAANLKAYTSAAPVFTTSAAIGGATDLIAPRYGVLGYKKLIDCNDDASDNAITMLSNSYIVDKIVVANASTSLTTATAGVFPAASGAGTALAADQALSALTGATKYKALTLEAGVGTDINSAATLYFRVGTAQGGAATCSCWIIGWSIA